MEILPAGSDSAADKVLGYEQNILPTLKLVSTKIPYLAGDFAVQVGEMLLKQKKEPTSPGEGGASQKLKKYREALATRREQEKTVLLQDDSSTSTSILWAVFHVVAQHATEKTADQFVDTVMKHWMACSVCRNNYMKDPQKYLLEITTNKTATTLTIGLWRVHNLVSVRLELEKAVQFYPVTFLLH